jgi:light-harvesting protein B-800-850 alpha chain
MADIDGQAKIWLVVPPETGLMWLLGLVTLIAVLVHALLVGQTKWFPAYWEGGKATAAITQVAPVAPAVVKPAVR